MLIWVVAVVLLGLLFGVAVERLLARLGVRRQDDSSSALQDLRRRTEAWQRAHARKPPKRRDE